MNSENEGHYLIDEKNLPIVVVHGTRGMRRSSGGRMIDVMASYWSGNDSGGLLLQIGS